MRTNIKIKMTVAAAAVLLFLYGCGENKHAAQQNEAALILSLAGNANSPTEAQAISDSEIRAILQRAQDKLAAANTSQGKRDLQTNPGIVYADEFFSSTTGDARASMVKSFAKKNNITSEEEKRLIEISHCENTNSCPDMYGQYFGQGKLDARRYVTAKCHPVGWNCGTCYGWVFYAGPDFWTAAVICAWAKGCWMRVVTSCG